MTTCRSELPWPCGESVAGGTNPLGSILCARHLVAQIAPPRDPLSLQERQALRRHHRIDRSGPETAQALKAEPPWLEVIRIVRTPDVIHLHYDVTDPKFLVVPPTSGDLPAGCRSAAQKAHTAGFEVQISVVATDILLKAVRGDRYVTIAWLDGKFRKAWHYENRELNTLGYRAAVALLV